MSQFYTAFVLFTNTKIKKVDKTFVTNNMRQVVGEISEHDYLYLIIQIDHRKFYHGKITLIGYLDNKYVHKRGIGQHM